MWASTRTRASSQACRENGNSSCRTRASQGKSRRRTLRPSQTSLHSIRMPQRVLARLREQSKTLSGTNSACRRHLARVPARRVRARLQLLRRPTRRTSVISSSVLGPHLLLPACHVDHKLRRAQGRQLNLRRRLSSRRRRVLIVWPRSVSSRSRREVTRPLRSPRWTASARRGLSRRPTNACLHRLLAHRRLRSRGGHLRHRRLSLKDKRRTGQHQRDLCHRPVPRRRRRQAERSSSNSSLRRQTCFAGSSKSSSSINACRSNANSSNANSSNKNSSRRSSSEFNSSNRLSRSSRRRTIWSCRSVARTSLADGSPRLSSPTLISSSGSRRSAQMRTQTSSIATLSRLAKGA